MTTQAEATPVLQAIPKPLEPRTPKLRVAIITDMGFKAGGVVAYNEDEFRALLEDESTPWLIFRSLEYRERDSNGRASEYNEEVLRIERKHIIAWAISPIRRAADIQIARPTLQ